MKTEGLSWMQSVSTWGLGSQTFKKYVNETWKNNKIIIYPTVFYCPVSPSGRRQWCAIGVLVAVMIVVLILLFALWCRWTLTSDDVHLVTLNGQMKMEDVRPVSPPVTPFTHSKEKPAGERLLCSAFNESNKWGGGASLEGTLVLLHTGVLQWLLETVVGDGDGRKSLVTIFEFNSDQWLKSLGFELTPTEYSKLNTLD